MRVSLVLGPVTGRVALGPRDGDHAGLAAQQPAVLAPLSVRRVLRAVVPATLAACTAALTWQHHGAVFHLAALLYAVSTLHETVLQRSFRLKAPPVKQQELIQNRIYQTTDI